MEKNKIPNSKNYRNGSFQNTSPTPMKPEDMSYFQIIKGMLNRPENVRPPKILPFIKSDLKSLNSEELVIVWFGHSSYLIHYKGKNILVDPVFSGHASPFPFMIKAFKGSNEYKVEDMPEIDLLILTHNHYDHLDIETLKKNKRENEKLSNNAWSGKVVGTLQHQ